MLTEEQSEKLKELAYSGNMSMAAVVRKALDRFMENQEPDGHVCPKPFMPEGKYRSVPHIPHGPETYIDEEFMR